MAIEMSRLQLINKRDDDNGDDADNNKSMHKYFGNSSAQLMSSQRKTETELYILCKAKLAHERSHNIT